MTSRKGSFELQSSQNNSSTQRGSKPKKRLLISLPQPPLLEVDK